MGQISKILSAINNVHTVLQKTLDCGPVLGGLNQVDGPNHLSPDIITGLK